MTQERLKRETRFHDNLHDTNNAARQRVDQYYTLLDKCCESHARAVRQNPAHRKFLLYGTDFPRDLPLDSDRELVGIDISSKAIWNARRVARDEGLQNRFLLSLMNAETLAFQDNSFDVVFGQSMLHHLELSSSLREMARVLRPNGKAVFIEPLGHNPVINLYRRLTPSMRTEDEHPLLMRDFRTCARHFRKVRISYHVLLFSLAIPLLTRLGIPRRLLGFLAGLDRRLLRIPALRKYAWMVVMEMTRPFKKR